MVVHINFSTNQVLGAESAIYLADNIVGDGNTGCVVTMERPVRVAMME